MNDPFKDALCAGHDPNKPNPWDPPEIRGRASTANLARCHLEAIALCNGCPATTACAQRALAGGRGIHGIWAGVHIPATGTNRHTSVTRKAALERLRVIAGVAA